MKLPSPGTSLFVQATAFLSGAFFLASAPAATVTSPNSNLVGTVVITSGRLTFSVAYKGQTVVKPSALGVTVATQDLGLASALGTPTTQTISETYSLKGGHSTATNNCNVASFPVTPTATSAPAWTLEVRAFNDGIAYRYNVPGSGSRTVTGETTQWILPTGGTIWYQDAGNSAYESTFVTSTVSALATNAQLRTTGVVQLTGTIPLYVMMTEANLVGYSDLSLQYTASNTFKAVFLNDASGWTNTGALLSPWRVTVVAPDLTTLVNTDILPNLCPAPTTALASATWIKPGRSAWEWLVQNHPIYATQTQWVDWTSQAGYEYYLIDDGWKNWTAPGLDAFGCIKTVADYARTKNVAVWAWVNSSDVTTAAQRATYFQNAKNAGLVGLKIDFPGAPNTTWVQWYDDTLTDAATYQLMVDFHGAVKPTGRERTWPQEVSREAISGREGGIRPAVHDTALPFTRFVQGHADYTPTDFRTFNLSTNTYGHELAQAIVYTSPFFCYGGDPADYMRNQAAELIKKIPSIWDQTVVLPGSVVGQTAAFARRTGNDWFVGAVNGATATTLTVNLSFLTAGVAYTLDEFADSSTTNAGWVRTRTSVTSTGSFSANLRATGGMVAHLVPTSLLPAAVTGTTAMGGANIVQVAWNTVSGAATYSVQRATVSGGPYYTVATGLTGTAFTDPKAGTGVTYYYIVSAVSGDGAGDPSAEASATPTSNGLAAGWNDADVGNTNNKGNSTFLNGVYTLNGAGADIYSGSDTFHFLSQGWTGDGVLTARVATQDDYGPWTKSGVMFRETLATNAKYAFSFLTPGNGAAYQLYTASGSVSNNTTGVSATYWVQLTRQGNSFSSYMSPDGVTWTQVGPAESVPMAASIYAGLVTCSHAAGILGTATMDNVSLLATPTGLSVTYLSESQLRLTWTNGSTGQSGYTVRRSPSGANTWTTVSGTLDAGAVSLVDAGLTAATSYDYQVVPNGPGASVTPATMMVTTPAGIGDGIPGAWRYQYFGNGLTLTAASAFNADPDGDGITNFMEYATGSNPMLGGGAVSQVGRSSDGTQLTISFNRIADPALTYSVMATNDLAAGVWSEQVWSSTGAANTAGPVTVTDTVATSGNPHRFLRLQISH